MIGDRKMGGIKGFEDLKVWQKSHALVLEVYKVTQQFPKDEKVGLLFVVGKRLKLSKRQKISRTFQSKRGSRKNVKWLDKISLKPKT